jgi:hypothetical protein
MTVIDWISENWYYVFLIGLMFSGVGSIIYFNEKFPDPTIEDIFCMEQQVHYKDIGSFNCDGFNRIDDNHVVCDCGYSLSGMLWVRYDVYEEWKRKSINCGVN